MYAYIVLLVLTYIYGALFLKLAYSRKCFLFTSFTTMAIVLGLRGSMVGEDTAHFLNLYEVLSKIPLKTVFSGITETVWAVQWGVERKIENGYVLLNKLIHCFTDNGQWLLIVTAALTCYLIAKFIFDNISKHVFIATQVFMCEALYMNSFNLMRQLLALAIAINAYTFLKAKKWKKAALIMIIAFFFHKSSLMLAGLFPLTMVKVDRKYIRYVLFGGISINVLMPIVLAIVTKLIPRYISYFSVNYWTNTVGGTIIMWIIEIGICCWIYLKGINSRDTFVAVICTILYIVLDIVGLNISAFSRASLFYRAFLMMLFACFVSYIPRRYRKLYYLGLMVVISAEFFSYAGADARVYSLFWQ